jgi:HK97 family phage portal protein
MLFMLTERKRTWSPFRRRAEDRALSKVTLPGVLFGSTNGDQVLGPKAAMALADVFACVRRIADTAASLPLHVFRRTDLGRERVEDGVADLLLHPAPAVTQPAFVAQAIAQMVLWGECFIAKYRDGEGAVAQLGLIDPSAVQVEVKGGMSFFGIADEVGRWNVYTERDVIHARGLSVDGVRGVSAIKVAREAVSYAKALGEFGAAFMRNGARPAGVLTVPPGPASEELIENLREGFEARHTDPGRVAVLSGEVSFAAVTMPLQDAEYIAQREFSTREICRILGVFPWMVGAASGDSLTYSNTSEQVRAHLTFSVSPLLRYVEAALAADAELFPPESRQYPAFVLDALLRPDPATRAQVYTAALNESTGWMTRAEVRELEDLPAEQEAMQSA